MPFDKQITFTPGHIRMLNMRDAAQAERNGELLVKALGAETFAVLLPDLLAGLGNSADPDMALNNLERFVSSLDDLPAFLLLCRTKPDLLAHLLVIFGASRFLSTFLVSSPADCLSLLIDPRLAGASNDRRMLSDRLAALLKGVKDDNGFFSALRHFRKQEMLRIGLRDLLGADLRETVEDLSDLAEVSLQAAYERTEAELTRRHGRPIIDQPDGPRATAGFAVIAMGKLGGRELNFSSDVDLMYVYTGDGETEGVSSEGGMTNRITNHQYFIKLAEKLTAAINEKTGDGFVFRVDLRLRPEGQRGPLAQSLGGYEIYYESWGQTWERSALIKARPVAGDEAVGREFLERITPFVFRKYLDYGSIAEIRDMKQKINKEVEQKGRTHRDVKLGYGGIREIEFIIQAIQLIYGGRDRTLRERNALKALHQLSQKGLITYQEFDVLSKAYVFLRTVEHRIQIMDDLQTQTMPLDGQELRVLARRTGYRDGGREAELLLRDYTDHTRKVRRIYDDLFAFTGEEPVPLSVGHDYDILLSPETTEQEAIALLQRLCFQDPGKAYRNLLLLREGPAFVHQTPRGRKLFSELFPELFGAITASPDPDMALLHFESFLAAQGSWDAFQSLVKLDRASLSVLVAVFANSEYLSRMLVSRPEFLQNLLEPRRRFGVGACAQFTNELVESLDRAGDLSDKMDVLRRFKHQEEIRIGMADLLSDADIRAVSRDLSKLAEVCLQAALTIATAETGRRSGFAGSSSGLAIIGVGKLGGRELTYGSDLDILFVFSESRAERLPPEMTAFEYFSKVAEKTISYLSTLTREGFVFRVDTRLRPTGSKGPLVQSIEAFRSYYASQAETWELQALVRARLVAGDRMVGSEIVSSLRRLVYQKRDQAGLVRDILAMRKRMEEELGRENAGNYNVKQGAGGLVDIEFLVQYVQLLHGERYPRLQVPGTYNALRAMKTLRLIVGEDAQALMSAYLFLRRLESRMRIVTNQATSDLSRDPDKVSQLARRMGYTGTGASAGKQLIEAYEGLSRRVREIFHAVVRPSP